ncbi:MAG: outer membrane lipoprotein-sorting protein, partial [Candidatus Aureabacteria bacterium]|nr:outer membrane lipoprotein-sorting protein [Candidatus Auribacterota bacterium]
SVFTVLSTFSAGENADEIISKANLASYYQGNDGRADVSMVITDSQGRERTREFTILRMDVEDGKDQKFYAYFQEPADVRKMVYMVWKHVGTDDDRWLYLPAMDLVNRIAAGDKRSSFAGSNFVYEDVSGRGVEEDIHELTDTTDKHYKIRNTPKDRQNVEFSYYDVWIDKNNFMPMKAEYYDKQGAKYRIVEALEIEEIQGHPTVTKSKVTDLNTGGNTVSSFSNIKYDVGLKDDIFTERYLKRAPRQYLK